MQAIILSAGISKRMGELTANTPKSLIDVSGKCTLGRQLEALKKNKIEKINIVTGFQDKKIEEYIKSNYSDMNISFTYNAIYDSSNNGYSLFLALSFFNPSSEPFILLNADTIFHEELIEELLEDKRENVLMLKSKNMPINPEDMKVFYCGDQEPIKAIGKDVNYPVEFIGVCKFSNKNDIELLISELEKKENQNTWFETSMNNIIDKIKVYPLLTSKPCMEIDFPEDLEQARDLFPWNAPQWEIGRRHESLNKNQRNLNDAMNLLVDFRDILNKYNIKYWLNWGLCLGAYRDGHPILHDTDLDVSILAKDEELLWEKVVPEMKALGCYIPKRDQHCDSDCFIIRDGEAIECNTMIKIENKYVYSPDRCKLSCPSHHIDNLNEIKMNGQKFNIPSDTDNFLKGFYGESWKTPQIGVKPKSF